MKTFGLQVIKLKILIKSCPSLTKMTFLIQRYLKGLIFGIKNELRLGLIWD